MTAAGGVLAAAVDVAMALFAVALVAAFARLARGPTLADRVVALDVIAATIVSAALVAALDSGLAVFVDVALAMALVTFLGTIALARAVESGAE